MKLLRSGTLLATLGVGLDATALARAGDKSFGSLAATKTEDTVVVAGNDAKDEVTILNVSVGFGMGSGLILGAKYFSYTQEDDGDDDVVISGYGPMAGFFHDSGFYLNYAYLLYPEKTYDGDDAKVTYAGGTGWVLDVGKVWDVGSSYGVGAAVTKSEVTYEEATVSGTETDLDDEWSDGSLYPYLAFFVYF